MRKGAIAGGAAVALTLTGSPAAQAETCSTLNSAIGNLDTIVGATGSIAGNVGAALTTANTAFLLQSTSFVSSPPNPAPNQSGSGVWVRGVGGSVDVKSPSSTAVALSVPGAPANNTSGVVNCSTEVSQTFAGVQVGQDIARLNYGGWNIHFGTTAGYLEAKGSTKGGNFLGAPFDSTVQTPFVGTYLAVTHGRFFADVLLRGEYYQATFNSASLGLGDQGLNARGMSVAASAGYQFAVPNSQWFIEPSAGFVWSRTKVDAMNLGGVPSADNIEGILQISDITSTVGRVGLRTGTTIVTERMIWQPFAAASVWHEFGDGVTAAYTTCCAAFAQNGVVVSPATVSGIYGGTAVGTYGQYSLGISGQAVGTGWVGFARLDYRHGENLDGWSGTGGIRYHFMPEPARVAMVGKSPVMTAPAAHNWTGLYLGVHFGAGYGWSDMSFDAYPATSPRSAGALGGGQIGYNYQTGLWVWGIEIDGSGANINGSRGCSPLLPPPGGSPLWNMTCHNDTDWMVTFAGRVGYAMDRSLFYLKGGAVWAHQDFAATCNYFPVNFACVNPAGFLTNVIAASDDRIGWTIGYGVEYALSQRWSARAETSYIGFGSSSTTASDGTVVGVKQSMIATKVGINYKLN